MIERIQRNEERLDDILSSINLLGQALEKFKSIKNDYRNLNKYYGSKNWFSDKKAFEEEKIPRIKAGVLSEDAVWNMNEDIDDLLVEMEEVLSYFKKNDKE